MAHVLTTDAVAPRERVSFWQEMVCQTFVSAHCDSRIGPSFRGSICSEAFGATEISRIEAGPQRIHRRPVDIARDCKPSFYLCYHAAGRARYRERQLESELAPGDMILLDNCEPYWAEYEEPVTSLVLHVPHEMLRDRFRIPERAIGRKLSGAQGLARVAGEFLQSSLAQFPVPQPAQREQTARTALDLFGGVLAEALSERTDPGTHQRILLARMRRYIEAHLGDPHLDLAQVAASVGVSVRHVARLFHLDGMSFGRYLLKQRIERCRIKLSDPALVGLRVSDIALDQGFNNLAHFSRVFREAAGCSPTEFRAAALNH